MGCGAISGGVLWLTRPSKLSSGDVGKHLYLDSKLRKDRLKAEAVAIAWELLGKVPDGIPAIVTEGNPPHRIIAGNEAWEHMLTGSGYSIADEAGRPRKVAEILQGGDSLGTMVQNTSTREFWDGPTSQILWYLPHHPRSEMRRNTKLVDRKTIDQKMEAGCAYLGEGEGGTSPNTLKRQHIARSRVRLSAISPGKGHDALFHELVPQNLDASLSQQEFRRGIFWRVWQRRHRQAACRRISSCWHQQATLHRVRLCWQCWQHWCRSILRYYGTGACHCVRHATPLLIKPQKSHFKKTKEKKISVAGLG